MSNQPPFEPDRMIIQLGDCLAYCVNEALKAFAENEPELAAEIRAEFENNTAQSDTHVISGAGKPAMVRMIAIRADGTLQPLALYRIGQIKFN